MPTFPTLPTDVLVNRLQPPTGRVEMVLDTDTDNELDDQYALTYALLHSDRLDLQAVYAAPYFNHRSTSAGDGMHKSFDEAVRVLERMNHPSEGFAFRGSESYLTAADKPEESEAVRNLIDRVMKRPIDGPPLYVTAIGAITNIASALLLEPKLVERIVVVWLGGHPFNWHHAREFNLDHDLHASRLLFDSGVPFVVIPCKNVAEHLRITRPEVDAYVAPHGPIGAYLQKIYHDQAAKHPGASRVIWDMSAIAWLIKPEWVPSALMPSPILTEKVTFSHDPTRHLVRCAIDIHRDAIFRDFYDRLKDYAAK